MNADERARAAARERERRASIASITVETPPSRGPRVPRGWGILPAWIACDPSLSPEARVVVLAISCHYNEQTGSAYPSLGTLASYLGRSERTVMRAVDELVRRGLVERRHRFVGGRQTSTAYLLRFDRWGGGEGDTGVTLGGDTGVTLGGDTGVTRSRQEGQDPNEPIPPTPRKRGDDSDRAPVGRRTDPASMRARERRIPVAQARAELATDERRRARDRSILAAVYDSGLTSREAMEKLTAHGGWMPDDETIRGYLREHGPARAGMLHGPVTYEPPPARELDYASVLYAVDCYARDLVPNACIEDRPVGYWLGYALRKVTDAA